MGIFYFHSRINCPRASIALSSWQPFRLQGGCLLFRSFFFCTARAEVEDRVFVSHFCKETLPQYVAPSHRFSCVAPSSPWLSLSSSSFSVCVDPSVGTPRRISQPPTVLHRGVAAALNQYRQTS